MKKILFLASMLAGCTPYHQTVSSYDKIVSGEKKVVLNNTNKTDIHQDFKQVLTDAGFRVYDRNNGDFARYELVDDINKDDNVRCGLWEDGYTYNITFKDKIKKREVFSMQGQGCRESILKDFTELANNRYGEKKEVEKTPDSDTMLAPTLKSDGRTWWGN